jgi:hypothetical protein
MPVCVTAPEPAAVLIVAVPVVVKFEIVETNGSSQSI